MTIHQVTKEEMISINLLFEGFVFRQIKDGKYFVKLSKWQEKIIQNNSVIKLKQ